MTKRRFGLLVLVLSLFNAFAVFGQNQFEPVYRIAAALDPIYIYSIPGLDHFIDFLLLALMFVAVGRATFADRFGNQAHLLAGVLAVSLSGGAVFFLREQGTNLFTLTGNLSYILYLMFLGAIVYLVAFVLSGEGPNRANILFGSFVFTLALMKGFFDLTNALPPRAQGIREAIDIIVALGTVYFVIVIPIMFVGAIRRTINNSLPGGERTFRDMGADLGGSALNAAGATGRGAANAARGIRDWWRGDTGGGGLNAGEEAMRRAIGQIPVFAHEIQQLTNQLRTQLDALAATPRGTVPLISLTAAERGLIDQIRTHTSRVRTIIEDLQRGFSRRNTTIDPTLIQEFGTHTTNYAAIVAEFRIQHARLT